MKGQQAAVGETEEGAKKGDGGGLGQLVVVHLVGEPAGGGGLVTNRLQVYNMDTSHRDAGCNDSVYITKHSDHIENNISRLSQSIGSCVRFNGPHNTGESRQFVTQHWRSSHTLLWVCVSPHTLIRACVGPHTLL